MSMKSDSGTFRLTKPSDAYWRVTVDIPPLNIFGPANIPQPGAGCVGDRNRRPRQSGRV